MRRASLCLLFSVVVIQTGTARPAQAAEATLRFDKETAAVINARRWDEPQAVWMDKADRKAPLFFDAVHRFLLLRFPGCADAIAAKLAEGHTIASAKLVLHFDKQEFLRVRGGYTYRGRMLKDKKEPQWHARAWAVQKPWTDNAKVGPTWNAYINGTGYWRGGGAFDSKADRSAKPLGQVKLSKEQPDGQIDITALLTSSTAGTDMGTRLRQLEACGFLLDRPELYMRSLGTHGVPTGVCRMWIKDPELVVTFKPGPRSARVKLPPPIDVAALAERLKAAGGDGKPTTVIPDNLPELAKKWRTKPADMPQWMWDRLEEMRRMPTAFEKSHFLHSVWDKLDSADPKLYAEGVQSILAIPPGYYLGHTNMVMHIALARYGETLPDVVRYHLRCYYRAHWDPPYGRTEATPHHRVGYYGGMATLNHQSQRRGGALLAAELLGLEDLLTHARASLSLLNRQMIYNEGTIQERGDTFYLCITLGCLQQVARFSTDPLTRLKASLGVEKMLHELNTTYHPGLRRQVSRIGRRYRRDDLVLVQCLPRGVLHTLSKKGVLIHTDKLQHQGLMTYRFASSSPDRSAIVGPWGREWESNAIDEKPIPFLSVATDTVRRHLMKDPAYNVTYLGKSYGLSSQNCEVIREYPVVAVWRRPDRTVEKLEDLGILFAQGSLNGGAMSLYLHDTDPRAAIKDKATLKLNAPMAALQHKNKMIYCMKPPSGEFAVKLCTGGIRSLGSRLSIFAYGPDAERKLWIDGKLVTTYPAMARQGQVITIQEGSSYVGLIPLPTPGEGRLAEVVINHKHPRLDLDSFIVNTDKELANTPETWEKLADRVAGWIVELGDQAEHGSFEAFQQHMRQATLKTRWEADKRILHVAYSSGDDTLEMGFKTQYRRDKLHVHVPPRQIMAYQRVNGEWPWPDRGIDMDSPLGQMGTTPRLAKAGAVLETIKGQMALLRVEPISGTYEAINPFIDPTPLTLTVPGGVVVRAEGQLGCGRITVQPKQNRLWVDYYLPPPGGDKGVELLQYGKDESGSEAHEAPRSGFFRKGYDSRKARSQSARALLVSGMEAPTVILNDKPLPGPFKSVQADGKTWLRIPIAEEK